MEQGCGTTQTDDETENNNNNIEHAENDATGE